MNKHHPNDSAAGRSGRLLWLPVPVLLLALAVLWAADLRTAHESLLLMNACNFLFSTVASLLVAVLVGRSFLLCGAPGLLLMGSGVVLWGAAGTLIPIVQGHGLNAMVTVHNVLVWLAAVCLLAGVLLAPKPCRSPGWSRLLLALAYAGALGAVGLVVVLALSGRLPVFFVQGQGGTMVRHFVLGSAILMFGLAAALLGWANRHAASAFARWYVAALLLVATGLFGIMLESVHGGALSWVGRAAQFLGGAYMLMAAVAAARESAASVVATGLARDEVQYRYGVAVAVVLAATTFRLVFLSLLGTRAPFVIFFPAVALAALYGGWRAGLLATTLAAGLTSFFWIEPVHQFAIGHSADWLALAVFFLSGAMISLVAEAMHRANARAAAAEAAAGVAAERLQAAEALRKNEQQLQAHVENSPMAVVEWDKSFIVTRWEGAAEKIFGWSTAEVLGKPIGGLHIIYEADQPIVDGVMRQLADGVTRQVVSANRNYTKAGAVRHCVWHNSVLLDSDGRMGSVFSLVLDITERKQAEEALRASEAAERASRAKLATAFASMTEAIFIADAGGRLTDFNDEFVRYHRFKDRDECSRTIADCPKYLEAYFADGTPAPPEQWAMARALRGETASDFEYRLRRKETGEMWWGSYNFAPVKDKDGGIAGAVVSVREITALKQAEEALLASELRYRRLFEAAKDGILILDAETGMVVDVNPFLIEILGLSREVCLGRKIWELGFFRNIVASQDRFKELQEKEFIRYEDLPLETKDGRKIDVEFVSNVYQVNRQKVIQCNIRDITERKQAEAEMLASRRRAELLARTAGEMLASQEPQRVVERLCRDVMAFLDCHAFFNFIVNEDAGRLHLNACAGIPSDEAARIEWLDYGVAVCGCVAQQGQRIIAEDIPHTPDPRTDLVKGYGIQAYCCHPLLAQGRVIGTLSFGTRSRTKFSDDDVALMNAVADLVALAMDRLRDHESLRESREDLNRAQAVAHAGSWRMNVQKNELLWSDENWRIFGVPRETPLTYETFLDTIHPDDRANVDQKWLAALGGEPYDFEHRIVVGNTVKWVHERAELEFDKAGALLGAFGTTQDITERKHIEETYAFLSQCGYVDAGEDFFQALARYLTRALDMGYVCIDRLLGDGLSAETVAVYNDGRFENNITYALKDTPCGDVAKNTTCCFPRNVCRLFPRDAALQDLAAESYIGTILWGFDGKPIGLIAVIGRKPMENVALAELILKLVAVRAAGELERKQAEAEIKSVARFTEENPAAVLRIRADGILTYANPAAARVLLSALGGSWGAPAPELLRQPALAALASGRNQESEFSCAGLVFAITCVPFTDSGYANIHGRDVTAKRAAEKAARLAHEREQEAQVVAAAARTAVDTLDAMGEGLLLLDMNGHVLSVNPALQQMTGTLEETVVGRPVEPFVARFIVKEDHSAVLQVLRRALQGHPAGAMVFTLAVRGGRMPVISAISFIRNAAGEPTALVVTLRDISELRATQQTLEASERKYRELVENANSIIMRITLDHTITFFNEYAQKFFGYTAGEILGKNARGTITPATDSEDRDLHGTNENENICKDGRRVWVHWANRAIRAARAEAVRVTGWRAG